MAFNGHAHGGQGAWGDQTNHREQRPSQVPQGLAGGHRGNRTQLHPREASHTGGDTVWVIEMQSGQGSEEGPGGDGDADSLSQNSLLLGKQ